MVARAIATFDGNYRIMVSIDGYVDTSVAQNWDSYTTTVDPIYLDPGNMYQLRAAESYANANTESVAYHSAEAHEQLASLGIQLQEINDYDASGKYHFCIVNHNPQSIQINIGANLAYITLL
jgi:hypothetical protein